MPSSALRLAGSMRSPHHAAPDPILIIRDTLQSYPSVLPSVGLITLFGAAREERPRAYPAEDFGASLHGLRAGRLGRPLRPALFTERTS